MTFVAPENIDQVNLQQEKPNEEKTTPKAQENPIQQQPTEAKEKKEENGTQEDPNWKAFREARKRDRAEREAAERRALEKEQEAAALKAAMEAAFLKSSNVNQQSQYQTAYNQVEETEDERIEKKVQAAISAREEQWEKIRQEKEVQEMPQRLQQAYPDFQKVCSQENMDYLEYHYPEINRMLSRLPNSFESWSDLYHTIKKFVPNLANAKKDAAKVDVNFNKPKSISSTGVTQPGEAIGSARLTEEKRAANWERMKRIMNGVS